MIKSPINSTFDSNHHHKSANSLPFDALPVELMQPLVLRSIVLALSDQQFIEPNTLQAWLDHVEHDRRDRLATGLYYAGMISHETARGFVPMLDKERGR